MLQGKDTPAPCRDVDATTEGLGGAAATDAKDAYEASKKLFRLAGVTLEQYQSAGKVIQL